MAQVCNWVMLLLLSIKCSKTFSNANAAVDTSLDVYVSPNEANISPEPHEPEPSLGSKFHPFVTLPEALEYIQAISSTRLPNKPLLIKLFIDATSGTVHRINKTLVLSNLPVHTHLIIDTFQFNSDREVIAPAPRKNKAIVSGGIVLEGAWKRLYNFSRKAEFMPWILQIPSFIATFNQLFVDGERAIRAREPEVSSYFRMQSVSPGGFSYASQDLDFLGKLESNALQKTELVVYDSWMAARRNVATVDTTQKAVVLKHPCRIEIEPEANSGARYYAENFLAALDSPREFFFDDTSNTLYFIPANDSHNPNNSIFEIPIVSDDLFVIDKMVNVNISHIRFELQDWSITPANTSSGNVQAASFLDSSGLRISNSSFITIKSVEVNRIGTNGIWIEGGSHSIVLDTVFVSDTGAGGLRIGRGKPLEEEEIRTHSNTIINSTFVQGSHVFHEGNGILLQKSHHNTIANCEVAYYNHVGINIGWTWDYTVPSEAHHNVVRECHVHHLGNGDLSDLAGIYLLGISPGTEITGNCVHDSNPYFVYGHAIYLDQATSDVIVENNTMFHTEAAAVMQHFGKNNTWLNNALGFSLGSHGMLWQANFQFSKFGPSDLKFIRNLVILHGNTPLFQSPYNGSWISDFNIYYNISSPETPISSFPFDPTGRACITPFSAGCTANNTYNAWKRLSRQDSNSIFSNPSFIGDPASGNFGLSPDSPAINILGMRNTSASPQSTGPSGEAKVRWDPCDIDGASNTCLDPEPLLHGSFTGSRRCGGVVVYLCDKGFEMSSKGSTWRKCLPDGSWSGRPPLCTKAPMSKWWLPMGSKLFAGQFLTSNKSFLAMQSDGNLCMYSGTGPGDNKGIIWCSRGSDKHSSHLYTVMQHDGNLCTYDGTKEIWCSGSNQTNCEDFRRKKGHTLNEHLAWRCEFYVAVEEEKLCIHKGIGPSDNKGVVWCRP